MIGDALTLDAAPAVPPASSCKRETACDSAKLLAGSNAQPPRLARSVHSPNQSINRPPSPGPVHSLTTSR
ncbi:hypothetical protein BKA80DRAFT_261976 [Phyllosticta citrichinensis]